MARFVCALIVLSCYTSASVADDFSQKRAKAEAGDFDSMLEVGIAHLSDEDTENNGDGIKWLEMSTAGGNVTAYYNLGVHYQDGTDVEQNAQKAIMYLTIAAELGEIRAMNRLAGIYYLGKLAPTNDVLAVKWGLCAAGLGNERANENVERMKSEVDERSANLGALAAMAWARNRLGKKSK